MPFFHFISVFHAVDLGPRVAAAHDLAEAVPDPAPLQRNAREQSLVMILKMIEQYLDSTVHILFHNVAVLWKEPRVQIYMFILSWPTEPVVAKYLNA